MLNGLRPAPIIDPAERSDKMRGSPITRVSSADGRWAYTLYEAAAPRRSCTHSTRRTSRAHCIDLDFLRGRRDLSQLRLRADRDRLSVLSSTGPVARVELASFTAAPPAGPAERDLRPWVVLGSALAAAALALLAARAVRRRPATA